MVSPEFKKTVESGDEFAVRSVLLDDLIIDRTFKMFDEALAYASERLDIIQPYDNTTVKSIDQNSAHWTENYLSLQKVDIMDNFSQERIDHIKKVIQKVLPPNDERPNSKPERRKTAAGQSSSGRTGREVISEEKISVNEVKKKKTLVYWGTAAAAAGAATTIAGIVASSPVIIGTGTAAAAVGVAIIIKGGN